MTARLIIATVFDGLASLPDASVDLVLSSPPFLALRNYLPAGHPTKAKEIGSEATPADYLDTLLDVVEACDRVLAEHGSLVFELGDTYAGSGGAGGDYDANGLREGQPPFIGSSRKARSTRPKYADVDGGPLRNRAMDTSDGIIPSRSHMREVPGWPLDKSLTGIPTLFAFSLAYGRNLLRPERTTEPWRIRNVVAWCRPNPPVGALADKFRPATSYLTIATKAQGRYFDLEAVRGPGSENTHARTAKGVEARPSTGKTADDERRGGHFSTLDTLHRTVGAPPLDWWEIPTQPYRCSHYATWPPALLVRPILAMCPQRVCTVCGEPSRRIVERTNATGAGQRTLGDPQRHATAGSSTDAPDFSERVTLGWTECPCPYPKTDAKWRAGRVLDPFAGSGTTLAVASGHGRDAIGIDLDSRNAELARERVGMFLEVASRITEPEKEHA